MQSLRQLMQQV